MSKYAEKLKNRIRAVVAEGRAESEQKTPFIEMRDELGEKVKVVVDIPSVTRKFLAVADMIGEAVTTLTRTHETLNEGVRAQNSRTHAEIAEMQARLRAIEEKYESAPPWYVEPANKDMLKLLAAIALRKEPEPNLTLEQMEERLSARDRDLWQRIKALVAKAAQGQTRVVGGGLNETAVLNLITGNTGGNFRREDLSAQCDGATKIFSISESYGTGSVQLLSTQFPIIYRPSVDFTESADKEITLTSEVGAPQTGQTLVALYEV